MSIAILLQQILIIFLEIGTGAAITRLGILDDSNSNHITVEFKASALEKQLITTDRYELSQIVQNQS